jgi:methylmalonyl-CoA mutase cobalamin-binding subunit
MTGDQKLIFRDKVAGLSTQWCATGLPAGRALDDVAANLNRLREALKVKGLWETPPAMVTATLDDGIGQGLSIIEKFAAAIGMQLVPLGLMQTPQRIVDVCRQHEPEWLGLTILQFDTEDDVKFIAERLPRKTSIVAGGPVFSGDLEFARRTGVHHWAKNVAYFMQLMLDW